MCPSAACLFGGVDRNDEFRNQCRQDVASVDVETCCLQGQHRTVELQVQTLRDVIAADLEIRVATLTGDWNIPDLWRNAVFLGSGHENGLHCARSYRQVASGEIQRWLQSFSDAAIQQAIQS